MIDQEPFADGLRLASPTEHPIDGHIDCYGYSTLAGGWLICGWSAQRWYEAESVSICAHFAAGEMAGEAVTVFYGRHGLPGSGVGLIVFLQGENEAFGNLVSIDVREGETKLTIQVGSNAQPMTDQDVASLVRPILQQEQDSESCRELLLLLSTSGYGKLRPALNTLDGFVDCYGYHSAAGGWLFCGWVTRCWDIKTGPRHVSISFADGSLHCDKIITGFFPREGMEGRGIGFVMFARGPENLSGSLTSIKLQSAGLPSFIRASSATSRNNVEDVTARLGPMIDQIKEPENKAALMSLIARQPYTGLDTVSGLPTLILLEFDDVIACPPGGVVIMGWLLAKHGAIREMRLRCGTMSHAVDLETGIRRHRPDVMSGIGSEHGFDDTRCGFIAFVPCHLAGHADLYMEVETAALDVGYQKLPKSRLDGMAAIKQMLSILDVRYNEVPKAFDKTIGPAIDMLNRTRLAVPPNVDTVEFGSVNAMPETSIIIPLYGRLDYIEYQLAFLCQNEQTFDNELIFVLDDPPRRRAAERLFASAHARFQVAFYVLILERNVGFAPANNIALQKARGRFVCFMNSDVFPGSTDPFKPLADQMEKHPDLGVVGPVLLYADGSVQHEGMAFRKVREFGNWSFPHHLNKGHLRSASSDLRRHVGITGACMLLRREVALELGGFDESHIIGDFEDSDLCLRLHAMGLNSAVARNVEMYHLERKSQASSAEAWRMNLTLYNAWLHEGRWADVIARHDLRDGPVIEPAQGIGQLM